MTTGQDFSTLFDNTIDKSYSSFLSPAKKTILFRKALVKGVEDIYKMGITAQRDYDELYSMINTDQIVLVNNNQVVLNNLPIVNATFVGVTLTITTGFAHNLLSGNTVNLVNILGFAPDPSGTYTVVNVLSPTQFTVTVAFITGTYTAGSGYVTHTRMVSDYYHLFAVKAKFLEPFPAVSITEALNAIPIVITTTGVQNLRTGDSVTISGVTGNTAANGTFFLKRYNTNKFALYSDKDLVNPVAGNGQYISGGIIARYTYDYCKPYLSDKKIGIYSTPDINDPGFAVANKLLKLYPQDKTCSEITIDYMNTPPILIDPTNNIIDLELYYSYETLVYINDRAVKLFAATFKDEELWSTTDEELKNET